MEWTCCACEHQVDERYFDTEERMCDECMNLAYPDSITDKSIQLGASVVKSNNNVSGVFMVDGKIKEVDDGGLLWSQNLATSLITESETHPLGAKDGDRKSFNSRLIDYNSTVLDLIRRVDPLPKPRTSPTQSLGSNVKIGDSKGWSVSLITINN